MKTAKRLLVISRPIYWAPTLAIYWWGFLLSAASVDILFFVGLIFFTIPQGLIIFGINDIADRESDLVNPRKGGVDGAVLAKKEIVPLRNAVIVSAVLFLALFVAGGRYRAALAILGDIIFAYTYSVKPIRLKTIPIIDSLSNGFWLICVLLTGVYVSGASVPINRAFWVRFTVTFLAGCAFHALGTVLDFDTDKAVGERTIAQLLGRRVSIGIATLLLIYSFIETLDDPTLRVFFGLCSLLSVLIFINPKPEIIRKFKVVFFYILAVVLPVVFALNHFGR